MEIPRFLAKTDLNLNREQARWVATGVGLAILVGVIPSYVISNGLEQVGQFLEVAFSNEKPVDGSIQPIQPPVYNPGIRTSYP